MLFFGSAHARNPLGLEDSGYSTRLDFAINIDGRLAPIYEQMIRASRGLPLNSQRSRRFSRRGDAVLSEKGLIEKDAASIVGPSGHEGPFPARFVCFGPFYLDIIREQLFLETSRVNLFGKPIKLLIKILEKPNEIVLRDELCRHLWAAEPDSTVYANLFTTLNKVRRALDDSTSQPKYIETVRDVGYRFMMPVQYLNSRPLPSRMNPPASAASPRRTLKVAALGRVLSRLGRRMFPHSSAAMVLVTATFVGFGVSFVWVEGIRARSVEGLAFVSMIAAAIGAMVSATARLISRSRKTVAEAMPGDRSSDHR